MEVQVPAGAIATSASRRGTPLRILAYARAVLWCVALAYLLVCAAVWSWQRHLIFEPDGILHSAPANFKFAVTDVAIPVIDERRLMQAGDRWSFFPEHAAVAGAVSTHTIHGWWIPATHAGAKTVLYLHGNDGNVSTSIGEVAPLRELGYSVFLVDYSGYGRSEGGFPSEQAVYGDAEAAWNYLVHKRGLDSKQLFIYGHSLGGAIAIDLASRHPEAAGLVVESSFTSVYDMAMREWQYALLPVNLLLNQRFDSIDKVGRLSLPVLYIHGTVDEIVPFEMGLQLYRKSSGAKRFVAIDGGRHDNNALAGGPVYRGALAAFMDEHSRPYAAASVASR